MTRLLIATLSVATALASFAMRAERRVELPFYQSVARTPEWFAEGTPEYAKIHRVADFALLDQDGVVTRETNLDHHISVVSFFFTDCRQLCPTLRSNLAKVQDAFRDDSTVQILSHTVAPSRDDTAALRRYAQTNHLIKGKWHLLTGSFAEIRELARNSYFAQLPDSVNGVPVDLVHSETFVLVDGARRVRGVYDGSLMFDVERLIADIHALK